MGDLNGNLACAIDAYDMIGQGVDLVIFLNYFLRIPPRDLLLKENFIKDMKNVA